MRHRPSAIATDGNFLGACDGPNPLPEHLNLGHAAKGLRVQGYPLHISLIAEAHREQDSNYVFEDRLFAAPAIITYDFAVTLQKALHRIYYSDDQHPTVEVERDSNAFQRLSDSLMGSGLIKIAISRGWTRAGVWQTDHRTIALFERKDDAEAFAQEYRTQHHEASFAEKWLSGDD